MVRNPGKSVVDLPAPLAYVPTECVSLPNKVVSRDRDLQVIVVGRPRPASLHLRTNRVASGSSGPAHPRRCGILVPWSNLTAVSRRTIS